MNSKEENFSNLCHQDIYNFPFPHKLWIAVNSNSCAFIKWNTDGTQIELQLIALDNYLNRPLSIFKIKSRSSFVTHLREYSFQLNKTEEKDIQMDVHGITPSTASDQPWQGPNYSEIVMYFSHVHFLRHRIDLLANIRPNNLSPVEVKEEPECCFIKNNHLEGDLCYKRIGSYSALAKAQLKHQLVLRFSSEVKALESKLKASELTSKLAREHGGKDEGESMIELSADLFENPHDSVLYMGDDHRTAYAGFYGNCTNEQVLKFFGPYLPMYENDNHEEGEKRVANLNPSEKLPSNPTHSFEINLQLNTDAQIASDENTHVFSTTPDLFQQNRSASNAVSSSLQPIFIPDEEKDEDISMDEFIKFKEHAENQPASDIKLENIGDTEKNEENETNFKNFFNQYHESLRLLYEKQ